MSQLSKAKPREQSSPSPTYSPVLKAVLGSLDLQLEEELARYRRQRTAKGFSVRTTDRTQTQKTLDLISVRASGGRTQPPNDPLPTLEFMPSGQAEPQHSRPVDNHQPFDLEHSPSLVISETGATFAAPIDPTIIHNDYLESSEALQKNLADPKAPVESENSFTDNLLTPLGIGSMLLLLLSSATLGYVAMNPSSLSHLPFKGLFVQKTPTVTQKAVLPPSSSSNKTEQNEIAQTPNLAAREFVDLNLRSLSSVDPKIAPLPQPLVTPSPQLPVKQPAPLPSPVASPVPLDLPSALLPPSIQSGVLPQLRPSVPNQNAIGQKAPASDRTASGNRTEALARFAPSKTPAPSQPAVKSDRPKENKFLVVTIYDGDRSLAEARKIVPDASVRRFGASSAIQLSAFPSQPEAQKKVESLRKQGISAQVYRL